jgi:hypothetical protein
VDRLVRVYKTEKGSLTRKEDWYKVKGIADYVSKDGVCKSKEVHWYQCTNVGKVEFKLKEEEEPQ